MSKPPTETAETRGPTRSYGGVSAQARIADRRERLLEAALEEFGTRGFLATGVKDVCRGAGLTDRYFYESFSDSRELFIAVFDRATARLFEVVAGAVAAAAATPEARIRAAIEAFVGTLTDDPRLARVVFTEAAGAGPEAEQHMRENLRRFADLVAATTRPLVPEHVPDQLIHLSALSCVGAVERLIIEWQDDRLGISIDELVDYLVAILLGGLRMAARMPSPQSEDPELEEPDE